MKSHHLRFFSGFQQFWRMAEHNPRTWLRHNKVFGCTVKGTKLQRMWETLMLPTKPFTSCVWRTRWMKTHSGKSLWNPKRSVPFVWAGLSQIYTQHWHPVYISSAVSVYPEWLIKNRTCPVCRQHVCKYSIPMLTDKLCGEILWRRILPCIPSPLDRYFAPVEASSLQGSFQNHSVPQWFFSEPPIVPKTKTNFVFCMMNEWMNEGMNSWPKPLRRVIFKSPVKKGAGIRSSVVSMWPKCSL